MEQLEKIEKLSERANVSYEEAREALEACDWDLLDAMVYLEKNGKTKGPAQETYSTSYEEQPQYVSVKDKVQENKEASDSFWEKLWHLCQVLWRKSIDNYFCVRRKEEEILKIPVWALVLALLVAWKPLLIVMIVALFLGCQYSFSGKDDLAGANKAMEKASEFAGKVRDEYEKL